MPIILYRCFLSLLVLDALLNSFPPMDWSQEKQNSADDSTNTKFSNSNDEIVESSNKDNEKQRETPELNYEQMAESLEEDGKLRAEMPEKDNELPGVQIVMSDLNGHHEQMQEIKLD